MSQKITLARIKKSGKTFEISVDSDAALDYKKGISTNLNEVLHADTIFTDVKKGLPASEQELQNAFETTDTNTIADIILKHGEIQVSSEHRAAEREQKRKKLIHLIHINAIDSKTQLPHPPMRIEAAIDQGKIHLEDNKTVEEQFDDIIKRLRPIIPISIQKKILLITIPGQYAGKLYNVVQASSKMLQENWQNNGSWQVKVEIPAGFYQEFIDKLNSHTHGEVEITEAEQQ